MPRMRLHVEPYELDLYCPFCGRQVVSGDEDKDLGSPCNHVVCRGCDDPAESRVKKSDLVFECFEPVPASRIHIFAFREP